MTGDYQFHLPSLVRPKSLIFSLLLGLVCHPFCPAEVPDALLMRLVAEDFKTRQSAEEDLTDWATEHHQIAREALYKLSTRHPDAEVRVRCLSVLRKLVAEIYDSEGEGYVGIRMKDETRQLPGQDGLAVAVLQVAEVMPGSPAEKAGLQVGDSIISLEQDGWKQLPATEDFRNRIKSVKPRSRVTLKVLRDGQMIEIEVLLARRPAAADNPFEMPDQERIDAVEQVRREEHFKKWLLDRRNGR